MGEAERIAEVYGERERSLPADYYSLFEISNLYRVQHRERATLALLARHGFGDLSQARILEVGCGAGLELLRLVGWGASPANLAGVDLLGDRIAMARSRLPAARLETCDARALPFPDASFDLVMQLTLFSSVLDPDIRAAIAREMRRVLRPGGAILWYDMRVVRPGRPLVALGRRDLASLFPNCAIDCRPETLNPVLARLTARVSWCLSDMLSLIPGARSHYLAMITPRPALPADSPALPADGKAHTAVESPLSDGKAHTAVESLMPDGPTLHGATGTETL